MLCGNSYRCSGYQSVNRLYFTLILTGILFLISVILKAIFESVGIKDLVIISLPAGEENLFLKPVLVSLVAPFIETYL